MICLFHFVPLDDMPQKSISALLRPSKLNFDCLNLLTCFTSSFASTSIMMTSNSSNLFVGNCQFVHRLSLRSMLQVTYVALVVCIVNGFAQHHHGGRDLVDTTVYLSTLILWRKVCGALTSLAFNYFSLSGMETKSTHAHLYAGTHAPAMRQTRTLACG
jgi:hypothetical protein